jgi:hypothetical protein
MTAGAAMMRIIIEIESPGERQPSITTDTVAGGSTSATGSAPPPDLGAQGFGEAMDAGPPTDGVPLGGPADTAIGGQAIDGGASPLAAAGGGGMPGGLLNENGAEELIDAGGAPDIG